MINSSNVVLCQAEGFEYPGVEELFRPSEEYPEYLFGGETAKKANTVYKAVRETLHLLKLDEERYNTKDWNPLGEIIVPGNKVLIKPNLVMDYNPSGEGTECLYTQPGVVAAVIDYVLIALQGRGEIIVGDAPMQECKFEKLTAESGYKKLIEYYCAKGYNIRLVDFRELKTEVVNGVLHQKIEKSSEGTIIDLKDESEFSIYDQEQMEKLRITNYSPDRLKKHHTVGKHEYYVSNHVLEADVVINMPKPKTHRKAGVTIALKNMVGINVRKEFLPHHTMGSRDEGGDEYNRKSILRRISSKCFDIKNTCEGNNKFLVAKVFSLIANALKILTEYIFKDESEGSWCGNHTISKTIVDLNKILVYADKSGKIHLDKQRRVINIADMIISGEKEGPVAPSSKKVGYIVAGINSVNFDKVVATMMGADIRQLPVIVNAEKIHGNLTIKAEHDPVIISNNVTLMGMKPEELKEDYKWNFIGTKGWKEIWG